MRDNPLGQPFDDGYLPSAWLWLADPVADQGDVVLPDLCAGLLAAAEYLDDALEVFITANDGSNLALARLSGEIDAHLVKGWRLGGSGTGGMGRVPTALAEDLQRLGTGPCAGCPRPVKTRPSARMMRMRIRMKANSDLRMGGLVLLAAVTLHADMSLW
jgi:hypothetical protein